MAKQKKPLTKEQKARIAKIEDANERWENGREHHPRSVKIFKRMAEFDDKQGGNLDLKSGGDGDIGEELMYLMDMVFEEEDIIHGR